MSAVDANTLESTAGHGAVAMFAKSALPDFVWAIVVAVALSSAVSYGFESAPELCDNYPVIAALCTVVMLPMVFGSYSRRTLVPGIVLTAVAASAVIALGVQHTPAQVPLFADGWVNDVADNYVVFAVVVVVVSMLVYLLSRRKAGLVVLLVLAVVCCAFVQFLFREWAVQAGGLAVSLAALLGIGALFVLQGYRAGIMGSNRVKKTSFFAAALFSVVVAAVSVGIGCGLYYVVVQPLNLSTMTLKPFQETFAQPTIEYMGVSGYTLIDSDKDTNSTNDQQLNTNQNQEHKDNKNGTVGEAYASINKALENLDPDNWNAAFDPVMFKKMAFAVLWVVLAIVVVLFVLVVLRRSCRKRRLAKIAGLVPAQQVDWLYRWFIERFDRLKIPHVESLTPLEFALGSRRVLQSFDDAEHDVDFVRVTDIYQRACFGAEPLSRAEYDEVIGYYWAFFGNACRYSGKLRWILWRFWRI